MDNVFIKKEELNEWIAKYFKENLISIDDLLRLLEDLDYKIGCLEEEFEDYKQMIKDNYEPISPYRMYGVNENEFH